MSDTLQATPRTRLRRLPSRGSHDLDVINAILDDGFVCHLAFVADGQPYAVPTGYVRRERTVYVHGSSASRMMRALEGGVDVCLTVTLIDGLVLARSAFHHSMNYRSVVVLGRARMVTDPGEKREALRCFTNHIVPERWNEVRSPNEQELKATTVLALPLEEASAKVRSGPPLDDDADHAIAVWAGVVPLQVIAREPVADAGLDASVPPFDVARLSRRSSVSR